MTHCASSRGLSYGKAQLLKADNTDTDPGRPAVSVDAVNWQLAAIRTRGRGR